MEDSAILNVDPWKSRVKREYMMSRRTLIAWR